MVWLFIVFRLSVPLVIGGVLLSAATQAAKATAIFNGRGSIAFVSDRDGNRDIYLMDVDRRVTRRLTDHPEPDLNPAWSPDGKQIAFYSHRDGVWNLYVMLANGTHVRRITSHAARDRSPRWSPDGTKLAFDSTMRVNAEIFVLQTTCLDEPALCEFERLTNHAATDQEVSWSPDGSQLVFEAIRDQYFNLYIMDADGSNLRQITTGSQGDRAPAWSPDGRYIVYSSNPVSFANLYVIDLECDSDCSPRLLLEHDGYDSYPDWSPDGRWIVFESWVADTELFLLDSACVVEDARCEPERLTFNPAQDRFPVWWPG
jgi:TolB protein